MLIIVAIFVMVRISVGKAMHYKSPYKCAIWSLLVFLSLFVSNGLFRKCANDNRQKTKDNRQKTKDKRQK